MVRGSSPRDLAPISAISARSPLPPPRQGLLPELRLLVKCGASVNATDYDKRTCLHLAASEGLLSVARFLLEAGAELNAKDRWGGTPLRDAVRAGPNANPHPSSQARTLSIRARARTVTDQLALRLH